MTVSHALAFVAGMVTLLVVTSIIRALTKPLAPKCTATLRSGERCVYDAEHIGPHKTYVLLGFDPYFSPRQGYCWTDPSNGLHSTGFFLR